MITPKDLQVYSESSGRHWGKVELRSTIVLDYPHNKDPRAVKEARAQIRRNLWDYMYGDIRQRLLAFYTTAMDNLGPEGDYAAVSEAFQLLMRDLDTSDALFRAESLPV